MPQRQYAVFIPRRGFYNGFSRGVYESGDHSAADTLEAAESMLDSCRKAYHNMGAPEIGNTAIIVERVVNLTATEWQPLELAKLPPHQ